ncbi:hypothetical protein HanPSC8_Chr13g0592111 [Helianthus annuus]|nr:hypothetical protein HanPSC8_Chr13g0592111 [Helianthus annuus]
MSYSFFTEPSRADPSSFDGARKVFDEMSVCNFDCFTSKSSIFSTLHTEIGSASIKSPNPSPNSSLTESTYLEHLSNKTLVLNESRDTTSGSLSDKTLALFALL